MKTFDEIYEELKNESNSELEIAWKEAKKEKGKAKRTTIIVCCIINVLLLILFFTKIKQFFLQLNSLFGIMYLILPVFIINMFSIIITNICCSRKKQSEYNKKYKKIVIAKIMNNFYDNLEYFPEKPMPKYIYDKLKYEHYDRYISDDYFEAQIDNKYSVQMAEVLTQEEEEDEDSEGNTHTRLITEFHGLFGKIVMHKSISGELGIMSNEGVLSRERLKMDSRRI